MTHSRLVLAGVAALLIGVFACASDGTAPNSGNGDGGGVPTLSEDVQPLFSSNCALSGCHAGASPAAGLNLSDGQTHANTVNIPSNGPALDRIEPGQPNQSYLVHKIQDTQTSVGGSGGRMPLGRAPLSQAQIDIIRAWITGGAQDN